MDTIDKTMQLNVVVISTTNYKFFKVIIAVIHLNNLNTINGGSAMALNKPQFFDLVWGKVYSKSMLSEIPEL